MFHYHFRPRLEEQYSDGQGRITSRREHNSRDVLVYGEDRPPNPSSVDDGDDVDPHGRPSIDFGDDETPSHMDLEPFSKESKTIFRYQNFITDSFRFRNLYKV